jgi:hypothetical protein
MSTGIDPLFGGNEKIRVVEIDQEDEKFASISLK